MNLTMRESEKLLLAVAADVAQKRKDRGLKLNVPESVAIISNVLLESARDGKTVEYLMEHGKNILTKKDVMDGVADMIPYVQIEATFPDGTKLVSVTNPIQ